MSKYLEIANSPDWDIREEGPSLIADMSSRIDELEEWLKRMINEYLAINKPTPIVSTAIDILKLGSQVIPGRVLDDALSDKELAHLHVLLEKN